MRRRTVVQASSSVRKRTLGMPEGRASSTVRKRTMVQASSSFVPEGRGVHFAHVCATLVPAGTGVQALSVQVCTVGMLWSIGVRFAKTHWGPLCALTRSASARRHRGPSTVECAEAQSEGARCTGVHSLRLCAALVPGRIPSPLFVRECTIAV